MQLLPKTVRNARGRFFLLATAVALIICTLVIKFTDGAQKEKSYQTGYIWPIKLGRQLSSSFAETRKTHFHFGIDIRTNSRVGYSCLAVADGDVVRIKVSPGGYGKILYLQLKDGRQAAYAHLLKFAPNIEKLLHAEQYRLRMYRCEMFLKPGELSFKQGDIVAYSGATGAGPPHLHFEIRDNGGYCNPFLFGFTAQDTKAPQANKIALFPLDVSSEIGAGFDSQSFRLTAAQPGVENQYKLPQVPQVYGPIGLGVSGWDYTDSSSNQISFYGMDLFLDGESIFSARYDHFGFEEYRQIELERDYRLWKSNKGLYHHLWRDPQMTADFYRGGEGVIDSREFAPGLHSFRIVLCDYAGNKAVIDGKLDFKADPIYSDIAGLTQLAGFVGSKLGQAFSSKSAKPFSSSLHAEFYESYVILTMPSNPSQQKIELLQTQPFKAQFPMVRWNGKWLAKAKLEPSQTANLTYEVRAEHKDGTIWTDTDSWPVQSILLTGGRASSDDGCFRADFEAEAVYRPLFIRIEKESLDKPDSRVRSRIYTLQPTDVPIRGKADVSIAIPAGETELEKLGLYTRSWRWKFIDNDRDRVPGSISGSTPNLETYALLKDNIAPTASWSNAFGSIANSRPTFRFHIKDELSGVDDRTIDFEIDGQWVLLEYDLETQAAVGAPDTLLTRGTHKIDFKVKDYCGNETSIHRTITIGK
ncbi:MAG: M23 family metallopeptidase [bacterium]|nr:M23 family metallopeptidase [bacterium]